MKDRTAFIVSCTFHLGVLLYLTLTPRAHFKMSERFIPMSLMEQEVQPQPETPEPKVEEVPEPKPQKKQPKVSEDLIKDLKDQLKKTPTPKKKKPTKTPTPTRKPTRKKQPTKKPTAKPTATPNVTPTPTLKKFDLNDPDLLKQPTPAENVKSASETAPIFQSPDGSDYDFDPYTKKILLHLVRAWKKPTRFKPEKKDYQAVISFTIHRDGKITNIKLEISSGWKLLDESAMEAVERANPVDELPFNYKSNQVRAFFPFKF